MAKEEEGQAATPPPAGGGSKKLLIIIVGVLLLALIGVGGFLALGHSKPAPAEGEEVETEDEGEGEEGEAGLPPAIMPLEPFIVNLQVKGSFLKTTLQLEFSEPEVPKTAENDLPKLRDAVIRVLSGKAAPDILSAEGKEALRNQLKQAVNTALGSEDVVQIYFTEFIVQ